MHCIVTNLGNRAPRIRRVLARLIATVTVTASLPGCYLVQAASGQLDVTRRSRPIEQVIREPATPPPLRERLELVREARKFAIDELGLPEGRSYLEYADLDREYALWNVVATPEFSLQPEEWCFPIAGCVTYRGYFKEGDAVAAAQRLRHRGFDVSIGGVPTYSTLGHLRDPVFNTMLGWTDSRLVATIFHEMAHEQLYVPGDSTFNESYATVVADAGLRRWLSLRDDREEIDRAARSAMISKEFSALLNATRARLAGLYRAGMDVAAMRTAKNREFGALKFEYSRARERWGGYAGYDAWFARPLNNAHLAAVATYDDCVAGLRRELEAAGSLAAFHRRAAELGGLSYEARHLAVCTGEPGEVTARY